MTPSGARASTAKSFPKRLNSLPMQGIDLQAILSGDFSQQPSRLQEDLVGRPVLHVQRSGFILAVIEVARHLVQPLVQCAAVGDVHFLKSAANRQHRQAGGDGPRNQRKRRSIPIWVM